MTECVICDNPIKGIPHKISDGYICRDCKSLIPYGISLRSTEAFFLKDLVEKNRKKREQFDTTAHLGDLFIDGVHNIFCISKRSKKGEPLDFGSIFRVEELTNVALQG